MAILELSEFGKNEDARAGVTGVWETLNDLTRWSSDQLCEEGLVIPYQQTGRCSVTLYSGK